MTRRVVRDLYDLYRTQDLEYSSREYDWLQGIREVLWYLRLAPYPLEPEVAAVVEGIAARYVVGWEFVESRIEEWIYRRLCEGIDGNDKPAFGSWEWASENGFDDLDLLRNAVWLWESDKYLGPDEKTEQFLEDFRDDCETHQSVIREQLRVVPDAAGISVVMPYLPLGGDHWLTHVPLVEREWIDRDVLELCEACAQLHKKKCIRLNAIDPHDLAWHRFLPFHTQLHFP